MIPPATVQYGKTPVPGIETAVVSETTKDTTLYREGKLGQILNRIDLVAIVITLVGTCLLGMLAVVLAVIELTKLIANYWTNSIDRWLIIVFSLAVVWVTVRWKRSRLS